MARVMEYNNAVNMYTSVLYTFPGRLFGKTLGFEAYEFYRPDDPGILEFNQLELAKE